ncbi:DUF2752 domain-containing protein [Chitinophaga alhagiae]|nr:DUF2752 domain-containing protein [Chitinophaga alhagiae]
MFPRINMELAAWVAGLAYLAAIDPHAGLPSFCVFRLAGFSGCPGCGLGTSVSLLLHGELRESLAHHWLGLPALALLVARIVKLTKLQFRYE